MERARAASVNFDEWGSRASQEVETLTSDVTTAAAYIRRLDLTLRTPDTMHIAIAQRVGASLSTFDHKMAAAAAALGVSVRPI